MCYQGTSSIKVPSFAWRRQADTKMLGSEYPVVVIHTLPPPPRRGASSRTSSTRRLSSSFVGNRPLKRPSRLGFLS